MLSVFRRVLEVRAQRRAAESICADLAYTVSPIGRILAIHRRRFHGGFRVACGVSFSVLVHACALVLIGLLPLVADYSTDHFYVLSIVEDPPEPELPEPVLDLAMPDEDPNENVLESLAMSQAFEEGRDELHSVTEPTELVSILEVPEAQPLEGVVLDDIEVRKGRVGEQIFHVEGAVDRITYEIGRNLEEHNLIVVWLMDASLSLIDERREVADRLGRVYREIDDLDISKEALVSTVMAFGSQCASIVEPTDDGEAIVNGIRDLPVDESGVENVFSSILFSIDRYQPYITGQHRKMMIVVWTDESGDDYARLEEAVNVCQRLNVPVFTVGPSAMFGKEKGSRPYRHPEDGKIYQLPIDRGPDAVHQERIKLPYWFEGSQLNNLPSGVGPFALTRLARESGGAYFIKDPPGTRSRFTLETMLAYLPDYESPQGYVHLARTHPIRGAVLRAVEVTRKQRFKGTPQLDFVPTPNNYQKQLLNAQKTVAYNMPLLQQALAPFGRNGLEEAYQQEESARWRAWYDYTRGRLLAMSVRNLEYNWACATLKGKSREYVEQKSNRWKFRPDSQLNFGTASRRMAAEAERLLTRCVENNPGTPWELLARRELKDPFGFRVEESYVPPPPPPKRQAKPKAVPKPKPKPKPQPRGRRTEQPRKLERPKPVKLPKL